MPQFIEHLTVSHGLVTSGTVGYVPVLLVDQEQGEEAMPIPGPVGPQGATGATGATGPQGVTLFLDGEQGEEAMPIPGPVGPKGTTGSAGPSGFLILADGEQGEEAIPIPGPVGPIGPTGSAGPSGFLILADGEQGEEGFTIQSPGTITSLTAGAGLSGGTITQSGTIALDINSLTSGDPGVADFLPYYSAGVGPKKVPLNNLVTFYPCVPGGRLTLSSGTPISAVDVTGATSVFYTPFVNNVIDLWDGTRWRATVFTEQSVALGTLASAVSCYDVFAFSNAGVLTLELLQWTNFAVRATTVVYTDGRLTKNGDKTRLYLGTIFPTSTTTTEDSVANRYLYNWYNQVPRLCSKVAAGGSHTYNVATWRYWNNDSTNVASFVLGQPQTIPLYLQGEVSASAGQTGIMGLGLDVGNAATVFFYVSAAVFGGGNCLPSAVSIGKHFISNIEDATAGAPTFSDQTVYTTIQM